MTCRYSYVLIISFWWVSFRSIFCINQSFLPKLSLFVKKIYWLTHEERDAALYAGFQIKLWADHKTKLITVSTIAASACYGSSIRGPNTVHLFHTVIFHNDCLLVLPRIIFLHWLPVLKRMEFKIAVLAYKIFMSLFTFVTYFYTGHAYTLTLVLLWIAAFSHLLYEHGVCSKCSVPSVLFTQNMT